MQTRYPNNTISVSPSHLLQLRIIMSYPEDLGLEGMSALDELTRDTTLFDHTSAPELSSELRDLVRSTKRQITAKRMSKRKSSTMDYLFKISDPTTPTILAAAAILPTQPQIHHGQGQDGEALFCQVSELDIFKITDWLAKAYPTVSPTFIPINKAGKTLSPFSAYPTLGYDTTLPHHRPQNTGFEYVPTQNQFPVWYFFYGTLTDEAVLSKLFDPPPGESHMLYEAVIHLGKLRKWGGKYKALVDCPGSCVHGWAYEVVSQEQEDALRVYETAKYEVVRVEILYRSEHGGKDVWGCTFRFAGEESELN
jgi:hypothetical protein